jgi:hypothetical protein
MAAGKSKIPRDATINTKRNLSLGFKDHVIIPRDIRSGLSCFDQRKDPTDKLSPPALPV